MDDAHRAMAFEASAAARRANAIPFNHTILKGDTVRNTLFMLLACLSVGFAACLTGCQPTSASKGGSAMAALTIDQTHVCEVNDWKAGASAAACPPGQKVAFLPDTFGNEQLPIMFVAVNCDLRYSVALTVGGATCIYAGPLAPDRSDKSADANAAASNKSDRS